MELVFTFKVDGEKLTGSVSTQMGDMEITDGKVNGNEFSFNVDAGMGTLINHKCKLEGEVIKMNYTMGDAGEAPEELTLTKIE
ncbi:MAG: hypothetical protein HQ541_12625 [Mariniphaga sp.]|nr:hypothetical protein [Mariniphaga sp.]